MKNWKCVIGATVLAPVSVAVLGGLSWGLIWLVLNKPTASRIFLGLVAIGYVAFAWELLYNHCKKYWFQKGKERI